MYLSFQLLYFSALFGPLLYFLFVLVLNSCIPLWSLVSSLRTISLNSLSRKWLISNSLGFFLVPSFERCYSVFIFFILFDFLCYLHKFDKISISPILEKVALCRSDLCVGCLCAGLIWKASWSWAGSYGIGIPSWSISRQAEQVCIVVLTGTSNPGEIPTVPGELLWFSSLLYMTSHFLYRKWPCVEETSVLAMCLVVLAGLLELGRYLLGC